MSAADDLLHRARVAGLVRADALDASEAAAANDLEAEGLLLRTAVGLSLTARGLERHDALVAAVGEDDRARLATAYEAFLAVNDGVKAQCTRWQSVGEDPADQFEVIDDLRELVGRAGPALDAAAGVIPRYARYGVRLDAALDHCEEGDVRFVTDPRVDSVHSVWFELHEDFLVTLGRSREEEGSY